MELDLENMTDEQLYELIEDAETELGKRQTAEVFEQQVEDLYTNARQAGAIPAPAEGEQWEQPQGAHDAYKRGDIVTHNGTRWMSLHTPNVHAPGVSGWRELPKEDQETGETTVPEYLQPSGAHDAYNTGDQVTWNGSVYESVIDGNVWSPDAHAAGWKLIEG